MAKNQKNDNDVTICRRDVVVNFFDVVLFLLSSLVTSTSFMLISSLVLELWQFSFIRDWPEIQKLEIPPSAFCWICEECGELEIPNLALIFLMILNAAKSQGYSFYHFWVIKGKQTGRRSKITPTQIGVNQVTNFCGNFYIDPVSIRCSFWIPSW